MRGRLPLLAFLLAAVAAVAVPGAVQARARPAVVLAVSPTRAEIPVTQHAVVVHVHSGSAQTIQVDTTVQALGQDPTGALAFRSEPPQYGQAWLAVAPVRFMLRPGQSRDVRVRISIPPHQGGQRYLALIFRAEARQAPSDRNSAAVSGAVASTLILDVPGKIRHQTTLSLSAPGFSAGGPVTLGLTIDNLGNVYALDNNLRVLGGGTVVARFDGALVLAGASRREQVTWSGAPAFCVCHLRLAGTSQTVTMIRIPVLPIVGGIFLLAGLAFLLVLYTRAVRRRTLAGVADRAAGPDPN